MAISIDEIITITRWEKKNFSPIVYYKLNKCFVGLILSYVIFVNYNFKKNNCYYNRN